MIERSVLSLIKSPLVLLTWVALLFTACIKDDDPAPVEPDYSELEIQITQIPDLGLDYSFNAWLSAGTELIDLGEIEADASGQFSSTFTPSKEILQAADALFFITAEPFDDPDQGPSDWRLLEARFSESEGQINNAPFIISGNADLATGSYILATPTTASSGDEFSGIWFVDSPSPPQQGLQLPVLDEHWTYEGWVNIDGLWLSTGQFTDASGSDSRSTYSSAERPPFPFPGEDFVRALPGNIPAPDLRGKTCYITIEPVDKVSSPFFLEVMSDPIDVNAPARSQQAINANGTGQWILGTIKRK